MIKILSTVFFLATVAFAEKSPSFTQRLEKKIAQSEKKSNAVKDPYKTLFQAHITCSRLALDAFKKLDPSLNKIDEKRSKDIYFLSQKNAKQANRIARWKRETSSVMLPENWVKEQEEKIKKISEEDKKKPEVFVRLQCVQQLLPVVLSAGYVRKWIERSLKEVSEKTNPPLSLPE